MKFAYADPPFLGSAHLYAEHHPEALTWDEPRTHRRLIKRLCTKYPDGWAMSASARSLAVILPMCPEDCRVAAWVKPFVVFTNAWPAYAWEPVILRGGRTPSKGQWPAGECRPLDWFSHMPPQRDASEWTRPGQRPAFHGRKPRKVCRWIFAMLGALPGDTLDDLFPGSGAVGAAWAEWVKDNSPLPELPLISFASRKSRK